MTTIVGGLRARLIRDSVYNELYSSLDLLGWFTPQLSRSPVAFIPEAVPFDQEVPINTIALSDEAELSEFVEMGSALHEQDWGMLLDFYPENDSIGLHLIRDVKDILEGRMPSIGRSRPLIPVWDYTLTVPVIIFYVEVENVRTDKAHNFPQPWMRFWRSCSFTVVDYYDNDLDTSGGGYGGYGSGY